MNEQPADSMSCYSSWGRGGGFWKRWGADSERRWSRGQLPGVWAQPRSEDSLTVWSPCQKRTQEHFAAVHRAWPHQPWKCPALSAGECALPAVSLGSASRPHRPAGAGGDAGTCTSSSSSSSPWTTHFIKLRLNSPLPKGHENQTRSSLEREKVAMPLQDALMKSFIVHFRHWQERKWRNQGAFWLLPEWDFTSYWFSEKNIRWKSNATHSIITFST